MPAEAMTRHWRAGLRGEQFHKAVLAEFPALRLADYNEAADFRMVGADRRRARCRLAGTGGRQPLGGAMTARTVDPIRRDLYDGRIRIGYYRTARNGEGFEAFDASDTPLGRFNTEAATIRAIHASMLARERAP